MLMLRFVWIGLWFTCLLLSNGLCQSPAEHEPSKQDVIFGKAQVQQVQVDRPDLVPLFEKHPEVKSWLEDSFAGKFAGQRVYWIDEFPISGREGECSEGGNGYPAWVKVAGAGRNLTAYDRLSVLVYESINVSQVMKIRQATIEAIQSKLTADEYAEKCLEAEYESLKKSRDFLVAHQFPVEGNLHVYATVNCDGSLEAFIARMKEAQHDQYHLQYYAKSLAPLQKKPAGASDKL